MIDRLRRSAASWLRAVAERGRAFGTARGGNVIILVAFGSTLLMGVAAVGVDLGVVVQARRKAQGAVDIAAMLGASDIARAAEASRRSLSDNGYGTAATAATVTPGSYDATAAVGARFQPGGAAINAVQVGLSTSAPVNFGRVIGLPSSVPIRVTGTAATAQFAAFSVGSGLVALDGSGLPNAILGALLGTKLTLSLLDYNALLSARVDGFKVLDALGASLNMGGASYAEIAQSNASVGQVLMALRTASGGGAASALTGILNALPNAGNVVPISQIDPLGDVGALAPGRGVAGPSLSVMGLVSAAAALANGQSQVSIDLGATIPGLLSTKLTLAIGERRRSSGWVRPGTPNATVRTAQTRLLIEASLTAPLNLGSLNLPLYVALAPAQGTLKSLTCSSAVPGGRQVVIDGQTGIATLAIAGVSRQAINGGDVGPDLSQPALMIAAPLNLVTVSGRALATIGSTSQSLTFSDADITAHTVKSISSGAIAQSLTGSLLGSLNLQVNGLGVSGLLAPALNLTLGAAAPSLDLVLNGVLKVLGLRVGYADYTVDGTLCGQAVLVQ
ncbi:TadG family pilus assembly protein [Methylobacterium aerolatum]|uniref:Membrane protein n=1 Tax=Methylobacterium aerolatum TaxID=418708 RepID=A0ABU0I2V1_9HYPH|nr:TadG family pilus assembly protein [Methylobacterium aerolatum]MDQ0448922.1 putative membrane protein [Methylobacterium aerolatum]GJD34285.1 hypothetical protein FMGBMHLM_1183 [Methylobacterium aerolatum]